MEIDHSLFICSSVEVKIRDFEPRLLESVVRSQESGVGGREFENVMELTFDLKKCFQFLILTPDSRLTKVYHLTIPGVSK